MLENTISVAPVNNDPTMNKFNTYIGHGQVQRESPNEQIQLINEDLSNDLNRFENPSKLLDDEYFFKIRGVVNDLKGSNNNLIKKQKRINLLRKEYIRRVKELEDCKQKGSGMKFDIDQKQSVLKSLEEEIENVKLEIQAINNQIKEHEK